MLFDRRVERPHSYRAGASFDELEKTQHFPVKGFRRDRGCPGIPVQVAQSEALQHLGALVGSDSYLSDYLIEECSLIQVGFGQQGTCRR